MNIKASEVDRFNKIVEGKKPKGKSKYRNVKTFYNGIQFDSTKEANYCKTLDLLKTAKLLPDRVLEYERQKVYDFIYNGKCICKYRLDFMVTYGDGRIEYVDVKGVKTAVYQIKKKLMKAFYNIDIKEV